MKHLIRISVVCFIASLLFSSCSSNLSITKRHYNNGYYIEYCKGKQAAPAPKEEEKLSQTQTKEPVSTIKNQAIQNTIRRYPSQNPATQKNVSATSSNEKTQRKAISQQAVKQALKKESKVVEDQSSQIRYALSETKKIRQDQSERDGLSLFWIVILVLLILWALGFLSGSVGGLIHLLLVIALILLILWLLRIV